jgi:hypothetical protein
MIATVGSLLDGAHARVWELCSADGMNEDRAAALLAAWPRLAAATLRALDAVPVEPVWLDDTAAVRQVLAVVAARSGWQAVGVQPERDVRAPNGDVLAIARQEAGPGHGVLLPEPGDALADDTGTIASQSGSSLIASN